MKNYMVWLLYSLGGYDVVLIPAPADGSPAGNADVAECKALGCDDGYLFNASSKTCDPNPNFVLHSNGVTVLCVGAALDATGDVDIDKDGSIDMATERFTKRATGIASLV